MIICEINRQITIELKKKIGNKNRYSNRKTFNNILMVKDSITRRIHEDNVFKLHNIKLNEKELFLDGCNFLL